MKKQFAPINPDLHHGAKYWTENLTRAYDKARAEYKGNDTEFDRFMAIFLKEINVQLVDKKVTVRRGDRVIWLSFSGGKDHEMVVTGPWSPGPEPAGLEGVVTKPFEESGFKPGQHSADAFNRYVTVDGVTITGYDPS